MPMIGYTEKERQKDIQKMKNFIIQNPYPKYGDVIKIIRKTDEFIYKDAEYGTPNHEWMKEIYENILDKEIVKKNGEMINRRGDKQTMVMNYYTLLDVIDSFLLKSKLNQDDKMFILYNFKDLLSTYWDGVGDWRH